ncbi:non-ribosomal peptide synthase/amino acid adenylation enzyme [Rivularia sp. PCC 7116]|uniref:non-ribosomal peptide synthetase n=1 Tax=Rivularia sp. PCC 7116 TaxID=373994 RepID=UPI00029EDD1D|nr:non-ribosomal peptide synthetase [Rivularia sp. PCC 7116]AFY58522.1 non-ribosomal peptide synthase/amino acid adenylation enzyme [Rivularia sp. PCC 7116]
MYEAINGFNLSPGQKRLWILQQESTVYNTQGVFSLKGDLQINLLIKAVETIVSRHEILRTNFRHLPGIKVPVMVVNDNIENTLFEWEEIDLSNYHQQEQPEKLDSLIQKYKYDIFDFESENLSRFYLIKLSASYHVLIICLPSICADSWTINNLFSELTNLYCNQIENSSEKDEVIQYVQFCEWQNQLITEDEDAATAKEYWHQQYDSTLTKWQLPLENHLSESSEDYLFKISFFETQIDGDLIAKIESLSSKCNTEVSTIILACWQSLLWRLTGQENIIIGNKVNRRDYEELSALLGLVATWIPIKSKLRENLSFRELINNINKALEDAFEWQDYFVAETNDLVFPIGFEFEELSSSIVADNISFSMLQQYSSIEKFKIKLSCHKYENYLKTSFYYDVNYFSADSIAILAEQFHTILRSCIKNPDIPINQLEIISANERQKLLVDFNLNQVEYSQYKCIYQLFEEQVERTPNNIALVFEKQKLTYQELNNRANKLAHYLQKQGVKPESIVGLYLERNIAAIVGILGIIKAGGAYLPLDSALPSTGLNLRLSDAQVDLILTEEKLRENLTDITAEAICLDSDWEIISQEKNTNPTNKVTPENLVYVIYTSGSTGIPKGVLIENRQLLNYSYSIQAILNLDTTASFAIVSTLAADLGNTMIFPSLCSGGCLHIISSELASDAKALAEYFHRHPIDCLKIVPSHLKALIAAESPENILPRKRLILGGEATDWDLIDQIQLAKSPECEIINHYGPTETTVGVLTYLIESSRKYQTVPLGFPIANTQIYLLNKQLQPVAIGIPGEIYIAGASVARGYLNRPDLTQEKFIQNPFISSDKLYKTGDLGRYLPDGKIEFIGRIDNQVKIHGFRIELGEIEAVLSQHPAIKQQVVTVREDIPNNKRLVAYIVPTQQPVPNNSDFRKFLLEKLPEYMIPNTFVSLNTLPLTSNGKIDRQNLPAPDTSTQKLAANYVPPQTENEKILVEIWREVLGVKQVGINDNFFELGGDSILSIQIIAKAKAVGLQLIPKQLFEHQTIAKLAQVAGIVTAIKAEQGIVTGEVPLTPIQKWFFSEKFSEAHHWNQSVLLELNQPLKPELLQQALGYLLEHHDGLRLYFIQTTSEIQQINADYNNSIPFVQYDFSQLSSTEQQAAIINTATELHKSLDLSSTPLMQVAWFNCGAAQPSRLLIIIHHLVVDEVSWRILVTDLQIVYQQLTQGEAIKLSPKTTSFQEWGERLQEYANSSALASELNYWLTPSPQQVVPLPVDNNGGKNTIATAQTLSTTLSVELTQALLQEVPTIYRTQINEILLTALTNVLVKFTGTTHQLIALDDSGREIFEDIDLSRTVGWFSSIFPLLLNLGREEDLIEQLKTVKEQVRGIPQRGIGYGLLRYLNQDEKISFQLEKLPQPEIKFNYLGQFDQLFQESSLFTPVADSIAAESSSQGHRSYLLEINSLVLQAQLHVNWTYSQDIYHRNTIANLAENFMELLKVLINLCQSQETIGFTPSDFPEAEINQQDLDKLINKISNK